MVMNIKTMEGLAGADTSIRMISTPMSVAKEAENKGDTEKMKRALGYAAEVKEQAEGYSEKTSDGMKLDAREAKKEEKLRQEELIEARKEERKEMEKRIESGEGREEGPDFDSAEISEEGKCQGEAAGAPSGETGDISPDTGYDPSGTALEPAAKTGTYVDRNA